ncbi:hypothetical protein CMV30_10860 [Nibricoccus aquaticus]|uniref:Uncharacterized protein n=1 Tax=Nibricoccus aquaticus TaxID=2576891 RepID=A0A290Q6W2_9BACT|nr:hypothetical protein CMV30_10860 [Nibricoccus aquaticus]
MLNVAAPSKYSSRHRTSPPPLQTPAPLSPACAVVTTTAPAQIHASKPAPHEAPFFHARPPGDSVVCILVFTRPSYRPPLPPPPHALSEPTLFLPPRHRSVTRRKIAAAHLSPRNAQPWQLNEFPSSSASKLQQPP